MAKFPGKHPKSFSMLLQRKNIVSIDGAVHDVNVSHEQFLDEFIEWVESKGWSFNGATSLISKEEALIKTMSTLSNHKDEGLDLDTLFEQLDEDDED